MQRCPNKRAAGRACDDRPPGEDETEVVRAKTVLVESCVSHQRDVFSFVVAFCVLL